MREDYFGLQAGTELKLGSMVESIWGYWIVAYMCICLSVCASGLSEGYKCLSTVLLKVP